MYRELKVTTIQQVMFYCVNKLCRMNSASLIRSGRLISKSSRTSVVISILAIATAQFCFGDQPSSVPAAPAPAEALISALNQKVNLGQNAQIDLPKGFRF